MFFFCYRRDEAKSPVQPNNNNNNNNKTDKGNDKLRNRSKNERRLRFV